MASPLFLVVATDRMLARRAARLGRVTYAEQPAVLDIATARASGERQVAASLTLSRNDPEAAIKAAPHRLSGRISVGGQEHFYIEGQIALAQPREDDEILVHSATQDPAEVQAVIAHMLNRPANAVAVNVRRMAGPLAARKASRRSLLRWPRWRPTG